MRCGDISPGGKEKRKKEKVKQVYGKGQNWRYGSHFRRSAFGVGFVKKTFSLAKYWMMRKS